MVGTVRKNKPELPSALVTNKDRDVFSSKFAFTNTHALVSYCPKKKKNVLLMTTLHKDACVSTREDKKPEVILFYNKNKGGVDNLDKVWNLDGSLLFSLPNCFTLPLILLCPFCRLPAHTLAREKLHDGPWCCFSTSLMCQPTMLL